MRGKRKMAAGSVAVATVTCGLGLVDSALAVDIPGVQPAALDQPRINLVIRRTVDGAPLEFEGISNVEAYYDTGASGILLSTDTADLLGINRATYYNSTTGSLDPVVFEDVGVAGSDQFHVSEKLYFSLANYHPDVNGGEEIDPAAYRHTFGEIRTQIGPIVANPDPLLAGLDVVGTPVMANKVVVMDPRPVNTFADTMRTYVYNPNTPFNPTQQHTDPGIPTTSRHIKLSYGDFSRFTRTTPSTEEGPTLRTNPFIGWDPVAVLEGAAPDPSTPGIKISYNGQTSVGSWLLDTGAAASIISKAQASALGITYAEGTFGTDHPVLSGVPAEDQFMLTIGGIGGTSKLAGFYLDSLLLRTQEGDAANDDDPNHIRFLRAPVLVGDITVANPTKPDQVLTLDGIFGMNFLVASAFMTEGEPFPVIDQLTFGRFDWVVYDHEAGVLGLQPSDNTQNQGRIGWLGSLWDVLNGDASNWDTSGSPNFLVDLTAGGYTDGDYVSFSDTTLNPNVHVAEPVAPGSVLIDNSQQNYVFTGEAIQGRTGLIKKGTGKVTFYNSNTYTGATDLIQGTVVFAARQDIGAVNVHAEATVEMRTSQRFKEINIDGGTVRLTAGGTKVLRVQGMTILGNGRLDLTDNAAIVQATADSRDELLGQVNALIRSARNGGESGRWSGAGLTSSRAAENSIMGLAAILNDSGDGTPLFTTFNDEPVDADSILIKYTLNGDTDLNGIIDADDYHLIDTGYMEGRGGWRYGDFDYSGTVDADDYFLIDRAFLGQSGRALSVPMAATVPEPGALGLLGASALWLTRRRRRCSREN